MCLTPSSGIAAYAAGSRLIIRFVRHGCTNRPFFHLVVSEVCIVYIDWPHASIHYSMIGLNNANVAILFLNNFVL